MLRGKGDTRYFGAEVSAPVHIPILYVLAIEGPVSTMMLNKNMQALCFPLLRNLSKAY